MCGFAWVERPEFYDAVVLPQADVERVRKLRAERVPPHPREHARVECEEDPRRYPLLSSPTRIDPLLDELDRDPVYVFWG